MEGLYPELIDYIYHNHSGFMTNEESAAARTLIYLGMSQSENMLARMKASGWISEGEEINELIKDGFDAFKLRTVERIYREHKHELNLNLCPKCV